MKNDAPKKIKNEAPCADYYDSWMRVICSNKDCRSLNWIELGCLEDYSTNDRHAAICWGCSSKFWIDWRIKHYAEDHFDFAYMDEDKDLIEQGEIYCVEGKERP